MDGKWASKCLENASQRHFLKKRNKKKNPGEVPRTPIGEGGSHTLPTLAAFAAR